ncbi:prenyltransferase/squalene oxidase repeat-containing protein [Paenibacillus dokdonensis]|uniref:Prenyltransferase/squalene oxidase repeat-containing protein n=1 Tax=Paenibacillus dokdonensis TaxID=2567944 RepID=A0ABU6GEY4_9BACL|nr:prenyltransferase/squalene oxidase repeat-containing protein [Paenibacillus dokdonensis]MEC0238293.1 prenyltransferase/squalene oxidase repeat-containing protein [Paenibacillus dokdonensis]
MTELLEKVQAEIGRYIARIQSEQQKNGAWRYDFETGPMTDASMMILLSILDPGEKELLMQLAQRLVRKQAEGGEWKQYDDDDGHLSSTVEAYTALLLSGYMDRDAPQMKRAEDYILRSGGVEKVHISTKFMLALNGLYPWPAFYPLPLWLIHLPKWVPFSFYRWSSYVKTHFAPVLILGHLKYTLPHPSGADISHLYATQKHRMLRQQIHRHRQLQEQRNNNHAVFFKSKRSNLALQKAEKYMLEHIEGDGTLYSYASATFFMIYALLSTGYKPDSPVISHAMKGLLSFVTQTDSGELHMQNSPSTVWDTALASYTLQEAGLSAADETVQRAAVYLLSLQHADKKESAKGSLLHISGGWGFSESNTANPDVDDTQVVLRALTHCTFHQEGCHEAWRKGVRYLFRMQNDDGGWAAFERNSTSFMTRLFDIENFEDTAFDPSAADVTGRTLEFLGSHVKLTTNHPRVQAGVRWLLKQQRPDGSWYGRWGVSFLYGTWAAVTGLRAVGVSAQHPAIQKAANWLLRRRQPDGGWGESCKSDAVKTYIAAPYSTVVHTAWALDTLIAMHEKPVEEMNEAISLLIDWNREDGSRRATYPTGAGLPGHFYIQYHSYPRIWPLLTLSHYAQKYKSC